MKQLCMMNDIVKHPQAIPRTLYVFASMLRACRTSRGDWYGAPQKTGDLHSPKTTALADVPP